MSELITIRIPDNMIPLPESTKVEVSPNGHVRVTYPICDCIWCVKQDTCEMFSAHGYDLSGFCAWGERQEV